MSKKNISAETAALRRRAEIQLLERRGDLRARPKLKADTQRLHHELQVHQLELEMQNAELQEARDRMEILLEKYTDLYDFAPVGHFSLDETGRIVETNLTGAALLGVERSRLINGRLPRFLATASQPVFLAFLKQIFAVPGKHVCEAALLKRDGKTFWASFQGISAITVGNPVKWCRVTISDITALKKAEDVLQRNEALFCALIEQSPVGVYVVDDHLRLQQVNPRALPVFNKIHPLIGRDLSGILHIIWPKKTADEIVKHFRQTLKTGKSYHSPDFSERRRDTGVTECYEWQIQRITLPAGHHGVVCFFNNVTERKHAEATQHRIDMLAASNQKLEQQIIRRRAGEVALRKSERHSRRLLKVSQNMQRQLRLLSRQVLLAQENERKKISRELHDVIAQTLTGINIRLATLKKDAAINTKGLARNISSTQRLVEHSVDIVHRFARDLRPAVLDDLGLIPALHSFMKAFTTRTGIRASLTAFAKLEKLDTAKRTVLYRVAQEALTNVARHAKASRVEVTIQKLTQRICMKIKDDGKSFNVNRTFNANRGKRLGLLGMRERLEMVGGSFTVESVLGKGTTVIAMVPLSKTRGGSRRNQMTKQ